jgi:hypothetical protein
MPEPEGGSPAKTEAAPTPAAGAKSKLIPILIAVGVFVVFVIVFPAWSLEQQCKPPRAGQEKVKADR